MMDTKQVPATTTTDHAITPLPKPKALPESIQKKPLAETIQSKQPDSTNTAVTDNQDTQRPSEKVKVEIAEVETPKEAKQSEKEPEEAPQRKRRPQKKIAFSRPYLTRKITIKSMQARRVFFRELHRALSGLYVIDVVLSVIDDAKSSKAVKSAVKSYIDEATNKIEAETERLDSLIASNEITTAISYSREEEVEIKIFSPEFNWYINILNKLDNLVYKTDLLWLTGVISQQDRSNVIFGWQKKLIKMGRQIKHDSQRAMNAAQRKGQGDKVQEILESRQASVVVGDSDKTTLADTVKITKNDDIKKDNDLIEKMKGE